MKLDVSADSFLSCFCISATILFKGFLIAKVFKLYTITIYTQILSLAMSFFHEAGRSRGRFFYEYNNRKYQNPLQNIGEICRNILKLHFYLPYFVGLWGCLGLG